MTCSRMWCSGSTSHTVRRWNRSSHVPHARCMRRRPQEVYPTDTRSTRLDLSSPAPSPSPRGWHLTANTHSHLRDLQDPCQGSAGHSCVRSSTGRSQMSAGTQGQALRHRLTHSDCTLREHKRVTESQFAHGHSFPVVHVTHCHCAPDPMLCQEEVRERKKERKKVPQSS